MTGRGLHDERYLDARRVTAVGAGVNLSLAVIKVVAGYLARSNALIADGIHSLSDLATDAIVVYAARHGSLKADAEHPYGHRRIETAFTVAVAAALMLVAVGITFDAVRRLLDPALLLHPEAPALLIAIASILSKEWLFRYTMRCAGRLGSPILKANAWHHRSDSISSLVVLAGVGGAMLGIPELDAVAAIAVAVFILKIGWTLAGEAIRELIDTGLERDQVRDIRRAILAVEGVASVHMLRTRRMGGLALVDVHVQVNPRLSVSEGHQIAEFVRARLLEHFDAVTDVTVHIDPEDDRRSGPCLDLPMRREVLAQLFERWGTVVDREAVRDVTLHYLGGRLHVDLVLALELVRDAEQARELAVRVREASADLRALASVRVRFE